MRNVFEFFFDSNDKLELLVGLLVERKKFMLPKFVVGSVWTDIQIEKVAKILFEMI